jgi:hypothetical protein
VVRLFDTELARKIQQTVADSMVIMSGATIAAPTFVAAALYPDLLHALDFQGSLVALLHRRVALDQDCATPAQLHDVTGGSVLLRRTAKTFEYAPVTKEAPLAGDEEIVTVVAQAVRSEAWWRDYAASSS